MIDFPYILVNEIVWTPARYSQSILLHDHFYPKYSQKVLNSSHIKVQYGAYPPASYLARIIKPSLAKPPLNFSGDLAKLKLTILVTVVTGGHDGTSAQIAFHFSPFSASIQNAR